MSNQSAHPIREERRRRELALRKADILKAAAELFAEKGFQGTQVAEIATNAGVSLNTVYGLYRGKEEIYDAVVHDGVMTVHDFVRSEVSAYTDPGERLLAIIDAILGCYDEHGYILRIYAHTTAGLPGRVRQSVSDDSLEVLRGFGEWVISIAHEAKEAGQLGDLDAETVANSIIGSTIFVAMRWLSNPREPTLRDAAARVRLIFRALIGNQAGSRNLES